MIAVNKHCLEIASKAQDISASGGLVATWEGTMLDNESSSSQLTPDVQCAYCDGRLTSARSVFDPSPTHSVQQLHAATRIVNLL